MIFQLRKMEKVTDMRELVSPKVVWQSSKVTDNTQILIALTMCTVLVGDFKFW